MNKKNTGIRKSMLFKVIFIIFALSALIGVVSVIRHFTYREPKYYVTVSFETDGGILLDPVRVEKGGTLGAEPYAEKNGYVFAGWYKDKDITERFYRNTPVTENITLYASFVKAVTQSDTYLPDSIYISGCAVDHNIGFVTQQHLTQANYGELIRIEPIFGSLPQLKLISGGNNYYLTPDGSFTPGGLYRINLLSKNIRFSGYDSDVTEMTFRIAADDKYNNSGRPIKDIKYVSVHEMTDKTDNYHFVLSNSVVDSKKIEVGSVLCIENDKNTGDGESFFVKVKSLSRQNSASFVTVADCMVEDVFSSFNMHFSQPVTLPRYMVGVNIERVSQNVANSDFADGMSSLLAAGLYGVSEETALTAPSVKNSLSSNAAVSENIAVNASALLNGLKVSAAVGRAENTNFPGIGGEWIALTVNMDYSAELSDGRLAEAEIKLIFYINATLNGTSLSVDGQNMLDYAADIYSQTDIDVKVTLDGKNITDEIRGVIAGTTASDENAVTELIRNSLNGNGHNELCRIPLIKGSLHPDEKFPVFNADFEIDYTLRMNLGDVFSTDTEMTVLNAVEVGIAGNASTGSLRTYTYPITLPSGSDVTAVNSYIGGHFEMFSGICAKFSLGSEAFRSMGSVGLNVKSGIFTDIRGYSHIESDPDGKLLQEGAAYFENAKYISLSSTVSSKYFTGENDNNKYTSQNNETPTFSVGERYMLLGLNASGKTYFMEDGRVKVPLFTGKYFDLFTGETYSGAFADHEDISVCFSDPALSYDGRTGEAVYSGSESEAPSGPVACDIDAYYIGSGMILRKQAEKITVSEGDGVRPRRKLTTVEKIAAVHDDRHERLSLVLLTHGATADDFGRTHTVEFVLESNGERKTLGTRTVPNGETAGAFDLSALGGAYAPNGTWDRDPAATAVTSDTVFTYKTSPKQTVVGFIYYDGSEWRGVTLPANIGSAATSPDGSEKSFEEMRFSYWRQYTNFNSSTGLAVSDVGQDTVDFGRLGKTLSYEKHRILSPDHDYDPITVKGTLGNVISGIFDPTVNYGFACYIAEYDSDKYTVRFVYTDDDGKERSEAFELEAGADPNVYVKAADNSYSNFIGWDSDGDGKADHAKGETLPTVSGDTTYRAVYSEDEITVYTYSYSATGNYINKTAHRVAKGTRAIEIITGDVPVVSDLSGSDGDSYEFMYWECSWDNKIWYNAQGIAGYRIQSEMYLRPVFRKHITLTIDAGDGSFDGEKVLTKHIIAGNEYSVASLNIGQPKVEENEYYEFVFNGWKDASTGKVYSHDQIFSLGMSTKFVAVYGRSDRKYSVKVTAGHGTVYGSDKPELVFYVTYSESIPLRSIYTSNFPADVNDGTFFWHCTGVNTNEVGGGSGIEITYEWEKKICITLNANGGYFPDQTETMLIYINEGETFSFETIVPPTGIHRFICWRDTNGTKYSVTDVITPQSNIILTAERQAEGEKVYSIVFDAGEHALFANGTRYFTISGREGDYIGRYPLCPATETYDDGINILRFDGWSEEIPTVFAADMTVNATWRIEETKHEVTYYINDSSHSRQYYLKGESIVPAEISLNDGETFSGWSWYALIDGDPVKLDAVPEAMGDYDIIVKGYIKAQKS